MSIFITVNFLCPNEENEHKVHSKHDKQIS